MFLCFFSGKHAEDTTDGDSKFDSEFVTLGQYRVSIMSGGKSVFRASMIEHTRRVSHWAL